MSGCCGDSDHGHKSHGGPHPGGGTILKIEGMTCSHCQMRVENALKSVPEVDSAHVDLDKKEAVVTGAADRSTLIKAVEEAGYSVIA